MIIKCTKNSQNKSTPTGPLKKGTSKTTPLATHTLIQISNLKPDLGFIFGIFSNQFWVFFFFFFPQILKLTNLEQIIRFWTLKYNLKWSNTSINILQNSFHKYSQSIAQHQNFMIFIYQTEKKKKKTPFPINIHTITD